MKRYAVASTILVGLFLSAGTFAVIYLRVLPPRFIGVGPWVVICALVLAICYIETYYLRLRQLSAGDGDPV